MSQRFAVVHEAVADFQTATELADRVILEAFDWLEVEQIDHQREWVEEVPADRLTWKAIPRLARELNLRAHGHFDGQPGEPDATAARRAIRYLCATIPDLNAIILIRDQDDQPERRIGLEQARSEYHGETKIVVGLAVVEREAWVLSGFDPGNEAEQARLDAERQTLQFDPLSRSHELTAGKDDKATRSPKRVLRHLSGDDRERERRCWMETPLDRLYERGGQNGLSAFLLEVQHKLATLIGHVAKDS